MWTSKIRHCKVCDKSGHTAFSCPCRERKPMASTKTLKTTGKYHRIWQSAKRQWFRTHEALEYTCYICGKRLLREEVTLDHIKSRGRHPELRYEQSNLAPCCWNCNGEKGSRDIEEVDRKGLKIYE